MKDTAIKTMSFILSIWLMAASVGIYNLSSTDKTLFTKIDLNESMVQEQQKEIESLRSEIRSYQEKVLNLQADNQKDLEEKEKELQDKDTQIEIIRAEKDDLQERLDNIHIVCYDYEHTVGVIANECANQPMKGQMAVAQVVQNRADEWGMTPEQVVNQKNQFASPMAPGKIPQKTWDAAYNVLIEGQKVTDLPIKWFRSDSCNASYHDGRTFAFRIGGHRFYM